MKYLKEKVNVRRAFMLAGAVMAIFALILGTAACSSDVDDDTSSDYTISGSTYTVYTAAGLLAWNEAAQSNLSISCILDTDIDMSGEDWWTPVGTETNPYIGIFDGRGHVISNINIKGNASNATGFVGYLGTGGWVKNLGLKDATVWGMDENTGAIVGRSYGLVSFCYAIDSKVTGWDNQIGGLVGDNNGSVIGCYYTGTINGWGNSKVGGFVGNNNGGAIASSYAAANSIRGASNSTGGFAGYVSGNNISDCYWYCDDISADNGSGTSGITEIGDSSEWEDAVDAMNENEQIKEYGWQFVWDGGDTLPYLTNGM